MPENETSTDVAALAVQLLSAYLGNNTVAPETIADLIRSTKAALTEDAPASSETATQEVFTPAVSVRKSLASPDHILSMIDGKPYKLLKRHLRTHGLTPEQYRERYNLPASYPMVAPTFAAQRREVAEKIGLGGRAKARAADTATSTDDSAQKPTVSTTAPADEAPASAGTKPEAKEAVPAKVKLVSRKAPAKAKPKLEAKKSPKKARLKETEEPVDAPAAADGSKSASAVEGEAPAAAANAKRTSGRAAATKPVGKRVSKAKTTAGAQPETKAVPTPKTASGALAEAPKPARGRPKLALFGRQESAGKSEDSASVTEPAAMPVASPADRTEKPKDAKAPRQKRMARTPKTAADAGQKSSAPTEN